MDKKIILYLVVAGVVFNLLYLLTVFNVFLFADNPWYLFGAGMASIGAAWILRLRRT
ncbi:MAG: hypothetical protein ACNS62_00285 [Candidatus Cyclobacteriaceae bacterium M3_2C_046]